MKKLLILLSLILLTLIFFIALNGCATTAPIATRIYEIDKPITIIVMDKEKLNEEFKHLNKRIKGVRVGDTIYTTYTGEYDINGNPLPDFGNLGHELWHDKKLGGLYFHAR